MAGLGRLAAVLAASASLASAATINHDFNVSWVRANPDGAFERPVIGINGKWPIPRIECNVGDRIVINVNNQLGNQSTSLHFHGLFQNGTNNMDGPSGVTQCSIPPGNSFTYNFTVNQPGTYWYHSHNDGQYPDGLRGPVIVHDPEFPYKKEVDEEIVLTLSDWYHDEIATLIPQFLSKTNPTGAEPVPNAALMNDTQNITVSVQPGKTYMFRVVNIGAFAGQYLWIEGHKIRIVEVDGVYTKDAEAEMVYIAAAQRVSFLLTTKNETSANYPIVASMDTTLFDTLPPELNYNSTGWLTYDKSKDYPAAALVDELNAFDDITLEAYDGMELLPEPDRTVELDVIMDNLGNGANYAFFNNITYTYPKVPTLYTALSAGDKATDPRVYGEYTHPFVLKKNEIVQIVVNNLDSGRHPFHLHGHNFQAVYRSNESAGTFEDEGGATGKTFPKVPMRRDTMVIWPNGNMVLRFKADNPGIWLFHCHIEWHVVSGLIATFVEAPTELQKTLSIPPTHLQACKSSNILPEGNAAGNTVDFLDLTGENKAPAPLPAGFTTRGIVALVFSCITGILGICVVAWYGFSQPIEEAPRAVTSIIRDADMSESDNAQNVTSGTSTARETT
ncbi:iron transport multicopper oxidase FET3 precursor [Pochonia chlamydosporia 170]|uniref:Iron transport multicopper oxidase FET3 n=1 Tax=Pochonia chlamydosporia 170 TaxID=1380566 RepID=A0A179G5F3_METCM|nr:iron transport multicopper oxidase FET3 precursor [Pochonia chlamydosporia 170]OAQ73054.2 iron transport multicopper oxidase FET3 precursor [Pochonia chlamydosporia 170]